MTGFKFTKTLKTNLEALSSITAPIVSFDTNKEVGLPLVVVGFNNVEDTMPGYNHYSIDGWVKIKFQGYDDRENDEAMALLETVVHTLEDSSFLDTLSTPEVVLHGLYIEPNITVEFLEHSNEYTVPFTAFTYYDNNN